MDVDIIKENIPAVGEESQAMRNGKLTSSAPMITMVTPRKPLMDLSQTPRTTTDDPRPMKSGIKLTAITPLHTPQLKKTVSKKFESSTLIYEDKTETFSQISQYTTRDTSKTVEPTYLNKLQKSVEDKMIDKFVSQVIDKCVADIHSERNSVDNTGLETIATDTSQNSMVGTLSESSKSNSNACDLSGTDNEEPEGHVTPVDHVHENVRGNLVDHSYCVSNIERCQDTEYSETDIGKASNLERDPDHNYCVHEFTASDMVANKEVEHSYSVIKEDVHNDDSGSEGSFVDNLQHETDIVRDSYSVMEEGEYFIDRSNVSRTDNADWEFVELEISDETCRTEIDAEHSPAISHGCETEVEAANDANVDSHANSDIKCQLIKDTEDTNHSESLVEEMTSPMCTSVDIDSGLPNPQGVTYMVSPKSDTQSMSSSWKQSITSPDCMKQNFHLPSPGKNDELNSENCQAELERDQGLELNTECLDLCSVELRGDQINSLQDTSLETKKTALDDELIVTDTSCSPMPVKVCNASVQNKPDIRSASNSPFVPYETHSAMTSPFVPYETHSATTSPFVPYETQTTSVNTENIETVDAEVGTELPPTIYVNIIKDQPEMKSISVSTDESFNSETENGDEITTSVDCITTNNVGVNTETSDCNSVFTNTDDPACNETSTMTEMVQTANASVCTVVETADIGIAAQPSVESVSTEMTDLPMSTVGTCMTPLKMQHKTGKRLTAEDIRKQHPRALANEFDSLKLQNERLETNVKSLEHERDKLKSLLKETKGSLHKIEREMTEHQTEKDEEKNKIWELANRCEELESRLQNQLKTHTIEVEELQTRCQEIEQEKNCLTTEHADQVLHRGTDKIRNLKEDYEQTNYRDHFLASQKLVQQLQSELSEYSQLLEDLEQSQQIQTKLEAKMSEGFSKVKLAEEAVLSLHLTLKARELDLSGQRSDLERREKGLREDEAEIGREREKMQEIVSCCKVRVEELDNQHKKSCEDLAAANDRLETLDTELHQSQTELTQCKTEKKLLEQKVEGFTQREVSLQRELELVQITLKQKEERELATNTRLTKLEDLLQHETEANRKTQKQSSLEMVNLQHTLESREQDIDMLEKDLFECREIIYTQMDKLRVSEEQQKSTETELKSMTVENLELKGCCAALRGKEQELVETLKYMREELSGTREHASRLLKEQGTEMADCSALIGELTDHMTSVLSNLSQKAGIQKTPVKSSEEPVKFHDPNAALDLSKTTHDAEQSQGSLVSMILNAARSQDNKQINDGAADNGKKLSVNSANQGQGLDSAEKESAMAIVDLNIQTVKQALDNVDSPTTLSRKKLGFTGASAFAPVRSGHVSGCIKPIPGPLLSANEVNALEKQVSAEKSSSDHLGSSKTVEQSGEESLSNAQTETESLPDQVQKLFEMFEEINRLVVLLEKASRSALQDIRRDNEDLNCRLSQCEFTERRLNADLEYSRKELQQYKDLNKDLQEKLEEMGDRLGLYIEQEAEVKRLQLEIGHLHGKLQSLEAEKEFLNDQMNELLEKLELAQSAGTAQPSVVDINTHKEILTLQKKVHRLKEQLQERQDFIEEISNKAARRIQKLEDNWKKADAEVLRFDELVDVIRKTLVKNETLIRDSEEIRKIIRLIDGRDSVSSFRKSDKLKPIKTSLV